MLVEVYSDEEDELWLGRTGFRWVQRAFPLLLQETHRGYDLKTCMSRTEKAYAWMKEQGADAHNNKIHKKKSKKNMKDNQQTNLKVPSHFISHYATQRTHARLVLERGERGRLFPFIPAAIENLLATWR